jgi:hypothetical protein
MVGFSDARHGVPHVEPSTHAGEASGRDSDRAAARLAACHEMTYPVERHGLAELAAREDRRHGHRVPEPGTSAGSTASRASYARRVSRGEDQGIGGFVPYTAATKMGDHVVGFAGVGANTMSGRTIEEDAFARSANAAAERVRSHVLT